MSRMHSGGAFRMQVFPREALANARIDPRTALREEWEDDWAVWGPRGGHWIASGPITWREGEDIDDVMRGQVIVSARRRDVVYVRPRDTAGMARWNALAAAMDLL